MKVTSYNSIRALRTNAATLTSHLRSPHIAVQRAVKVPDFSKYDVGTECTKAKRTFIRNTLRRCLACAARNRRAKLYFTPHWKYNNCSRAIVVGWPAWIKWGRISNLQGHETSFDILIDLLADGHLYVRIASAAEWAVHQAEGASQGVTIYDLPRDTAPRRDISHRRSDCHVRPKLRPVQNIPKSAAYIDDSDIEEFEEVGARRVDDDIQDFSDDL